LIWLLVALGSGVALAKAFNDTNGPDDIAGTKKADKIDGRAGNDSLRGDRDGDRIVGGPGADRVFGDPGNDTIDVADGERDEVDCGEDDKNKVDFDSTSVLAVPGTPVNAGNREIFESEGDGDDEQ
jgi:Ca2+-binding RTX toxin-like protein